MTNLNTQSLSDLFHSAELHLREAQICANPTVGREPEVMGFAAMHVALACVAAVGEVLARKSNPMSSNATTLKSVTAFVKEMDDKTSWIVTPPGYKVTVTPEKLLADLRDSLAHALSAPNKVRLEKTLIDAESKFEGQTIVPGLFVSAVTATINKIAMTSRDLPFVDLPRRDAEHRSAFKISATSGSAPGDAL